MSKQGQNRRDPDRDMRELPADADLQFLAAKRGRRDRIERDITRASALLIVLVCIIVSIFRHFSSASSGSTRAMQSEGIATVCFIDVGQGDCALILANGKSVLIDSGEYAQFSAVCRSLDKLGVKALDYVIMSHPHSDHMGCMYSVISRYGAKALIMPELRDELVPETSTYNALMDTVRDDDIPIVFASPGTVLELGVDSYISILAPVERYDDLNNTSDVVKFVFGDTSFLFTGDIEKEAEADILACGADISADVLKVPHHGSGTSSTAAFIRAVSPDYAVFCVGVNNDFGHPHANIVERYISGGAEIYRTDMHGNITFVTDGADISVSTEKAVYYDIGDAA